MMVRGAFVLGGFIHMATSVSLVAVFVRSLGNARVAEARGMALKATACTMIAVTSTTICYGGMGAMVLDGYMLLAIDSIVNDMCLIFVSFSDAFDNSSIFNNAQNASSGDKSGSVGASAIGTPATTDL